MGEGKTPVGLSIMQLTASALRFSCGDALPLTSCVDFRDPFHGGQGARGRGSGHTQPCRVIEDPSLKPVSSHMTGSHILRNAQRES